MRIDRAAQIYFNCGAPGSGKSYDLKRELERLAPERAIVIDPDAEYDGYGALHDNEIHFYRSTLRPTFRSRFRPSFLRAGAEAQFDYVCRVVRWHVDPQPGQAWPPSTAPVVFVVDELADFVGPSFRDAPASWQWIIRRGRKYGVTLLAASQRPAQIDKTLFDLASRIRTGWLNNAASQRTIADALGVELELVRALKGHEFILREKNTGKLITPRPLSLGARAIARKLRR